MNIAVIGSRTFNDQNLLDQTMKEIFARGDRLISGGKRCGQNGLKLVPE